MNVRDLVVACVAWAAIGVMALSVQAQTPPPPTPSPAFERAYLSEMNDATRAEVEKRATGGNTISGVIATMLLNSSQMAKHGKAGRRYRSSPSTFRGVVVIQNGPNQYEPVRFDPKPCTSTDERRAPRDTQAAAGPSVDSRPANRRAWKRMCGRVLLSEKVNSLSVAVNAGGVRDMHMAGVPPASAERIETLRVRAVSWARTKPPSA